VARAGAPGQARLVAYSLLITDLDPLADDLLFERLSLNPEGIMPGLFDGRLLHGKVVDRGSIEYCKARQLTAANAVSQIIIPSAPWPPRQ